MADLVCLFALDLVSRLAMLHVWFCWDVNVTEGEILQSVYIASWGNSN